MFREKGFKKGNSRFRDRDHSHDSSEEQYEPREKRPELQWTTAHTVRKGDVIAEVNCATSDRGYKMYSVSVGRVVGRNGDQKTTRFFRDTDLNQLEEAVRDAKFWVQAAKGEADQASA